MRAAVNVAVGLALLSAAVYVMTGAGPGRSDQTDLRVPADVDLSAVYDPVAAGEPMPRGFRQLLPRDAILPVYEPVFVPAAGAGWVPETLVIGLEIDGEAKAYPVSFLNGREMVIDRVAGIPILVTW